MSHAIYKFNEAFPMYTIGEDNIRGEDWVHKTIMSVVIEVRK
jgi:hypothetical protein